MAQYFLEGTTRAGDRIFLSPLPDRVIATSDQEIADTSGHFLYLKPDSEDENITILAQVFSEEAVFQISRLLKME